MGIYAPKIRQVSVRHDGTRVVLLERGKVIIELPWDAALDLSKAIHIQAKKAEEIAKAAKIIDDQAFLTRLGVPIGLTSNPAIKKEAAKEAAWNKALRKAIPPAKAGGIKSQAVFGTPRLIQKRPKKKGQGR